MADPVFDYDRLMAPVPGSAPCGPDLRDEPDFRDLEEAPGAFAGQNPAEIRRVVDQCDAALMRSKDHLPAIVALQGALRLGDIALANRVLAVLRGITETYWDGFHPGPAEDMVVARVNELTVLARPAAVALPLDRAAMAAIPGAPGPGFNAAALSAAAAPVAEWSPAEQKDLDARVASGQVTAAAARQQQPTREAARVLRAIMRTMSAAARAADADVPQAEPIVAPDAAPAIAAELRAQVETVRAALLELLNGLHDLNAFYDERAGDSASVGPALSAIAGSVAAADVFLAAFPSDLAEEALLEEEQEDVPGGSANNGSGSGSVAAKFVPSVPRTRDDVLRAIDALGTYYQRSEPSSPVPLMLDRLRRWVMMDFLELLQEIAPGGVADAQSLLAKKGE